ncbi:MAG TPA: [protein-PII] uridylyltransferase [Acidimicrobiales bacterium]|nr:[protein-PII] uridylyltransferase [Acidimicrobiales bacterium]
MLADTSLTGTAWCRAYSDLVDRWLAALLEDAGGAGVALVAVGGYGRGELCPQSDLDLLLVYDRKTDAGRVARLADRVWYPIWDEGLHLGHSVTTVRQALSLAADDLDTATALLSARLVAGAADLAAELRQGAEQQWRKRADRALAELAAGVADRHRRAGDAAFLLEPDVKEARGGLRDVHALGWAQAARAVLLDYDAPELAASYAVLLAARVELQRRTGRPGNVLLLQEQAGVAEALGYADADHLMAAIVAAARTVAWTSDDTWRRVTSTLRGPVARAGQRARPLAAGVELVDGEVALAPHATPADDPVLVLRLAAAAAGGGWPIERHSLERLATEATPLPEPWPADGRRAFLDLLATGRPAIAVVEALDQRGAWERVVPEWRAVRSRPQHNAYHRFTVDRHLLEAAANAAGLAARVGRPDLLLIGALLHDVGKGGRGDHSVVGVDIACTVARRMGFGAADVAVIGTLVRHHLLLADTASRRDLDDPVTVERVAAAVGSLEVLHLLAALTEADSKATGPAAWSPWKAELLATLVERTARYLAGEGPGDEGAAPALPGAAPGCVPPAGGRHVGAAGGVLTVVTADRPGVFSRVAGVLALHGLDVVAATAVSSDDGWARSEFRVVDAVRAATPWPKVIAAIHLALDGRMALTARLAERRRTYQRPGPYARRTLAARVSFDNGASAAATVIDVHAVDAVGVLYAVTQALAELDLDIRSARVHTLGPEVVDAFYVQDGMGRKVTDAATLAEIERAVLYALDSVRR